MKKNILKRVLTLALALTGCGEETLLDKNDPVTVNFWHVYGEQSGSPMDVLVQEFNHTVGQEQGVRVQVTNLSSASKIGGFLKEAQNHPASHVQRQRLRPLRPGHRRKL